MTVFWHKYNSYLKSSSKRNKTSKRFHSPACIWLEKLHTLLSENKTLVTLVSGWWFDDTSEAITLSITAKRNCASFTPRHALLSHPLASRHHPIVSLYKRGNLNSSIFS